MRGPGTTPRGPGTTPGGPGARAPETRSGHRVVGEDLQHRVAQVACRRITARRSWAVLAPADEDGSQARPAFAAGRRIGGEEPGPARGLGRERGQPFVPVGLADRRMIVRPDEDELMARLR